MIEVTETKYFEKYQRIIGHSIDEWIQRYDFSEQKTEFGYSTKLSAVYSANIEGNTVDLNSYMNQKFSNHKVKPTKEIEEIDHLVAAYEFAQENSLNENSFLNCHAIFSKTLLIKSKRGKYRSEKVGVFGEKGLVYLAVEPEYVENIMRAFFQSIKILFDANLSTEKVFYHASLVRPFRCGADGDSFHAAVDPGELRAEHPDGASDAATSDR